MIEVVLASQSPRRKQLLEWAEVPFEIIVKETDEKFPSEMQTDEVPVFIARNKALAVQALVRDERPVLAADTVVVLHNRIIGKPVDRDDAISILMDLSGQEHEVITGVVILYKGREIAFSDITKVVFHPLSEEQIIFYVDKYRPYDKAGAYAIQEWMGVTGIKSVSGDFYNVMGLPVSRVIHALSTL